MPSVPEMWRLTLSLVGNWGAAKELKLSHKTMSIIVNDGVSLNSNLTLSSLTATQESHWGLDVEGSWVGGIGLECP